MFHEHLDVDLTDIDLAVEELRECAFNGLSCIVDSAVYQRNPEELHIVNTIASRSKVKVIMAGGYLQDIKFRNYPVRVAEMSEDGLVDELISYANEQHWGLSVKSVRRL